MSEHEADPLKANVEELRTALAAGESPDAIAKQSGLSRMTVLGFAAGGKQRVTTIVRMHEWAEQRRSARRG